MAHRVPNHFNNIVIPSQELLIDKSGDGLLGRGGYGLVYRALYQGKKVAVKMLSGDGDIPKQRRNDLKKEARRLRDSCHHPHILNLIGVVMETNNYSLVLEYMHFGTCSSFIKNYIVGTPVRVQFAQQMISAMAWLHSLNPPVKHLDLKAENVLINNYFVAKISDFGLSEWRTVTMAFSRTVPQVGRGGPRCGTLSHIPPEVFMDINKKGAVEEDVYAFGVTLWEIFSGTVPFQNCGDNEKLIREAVINNQRPSLQVLVKDCPTEIRDMIKCSWDCNPTFRPTFKELAEKITPVYNSAKNTIHNHLKYIRAQIVTMYQQEPEEPEHYECTMHWDGLENEASYGQVGLFDDQVRIENQQTSVENDMSNGQSNAGNGSFDAQPCTGNGSFNSNSSVENRLSDSVASAGKVSSNQAANWQSNEQASPDGEEGNDIKFPPKVQPKDSGNSEPRIRDTLNQTVQVFASNRPPKEGFAHLNSQTSYLPERLGPSTVQTPVVNGKPIQSEQGSLRNYGQAHVPIVETEQKVINNAGHRDMPKSREIGLSGFVSVKEKHYTPGAQLKHPHGPIAQPVSAVIQSETVANDDRNLGEGRNGEEGDDEETMLKGDPVDDLLSQLSISNPGVYNSLLRNPDALQNVANNLLKSKDGRMEVKLRPELGLSQQAAATNQRPVNSCAREVTQGTQLLTARLSTVSVDQLSGQTSNGARHAVQGQQTARLGSTANTTVRLFPAPDQHLGTTQSVGEPLTGIGASHVPSLAIPTVRPSLPQTPFKPRQIFGQSMPGQPVPQIPTVHGSQQNVHSTGSQQTVDNSILGQQQRTNQGGDTPGQTSGGAVATSQEPTQFFQPPLSQRRNLEPQRQQLTVSPQTPDSNISASSRQSGVEVSEQLRSDERSSRQGQPQANQTHTGTADEGTTQQPEISGRQKQPVTIYHRHAGGGTTTITMDPDNELPSNLQIGNKNVMVVNDSGSRRKSEKKKKPKCKKSQLTTCRDELSMDHIDMISVEIGKDWKRLCRQLDMTEADIEQLQFDYYASGLYEIMYQGIQRWIQRNGRAANIKTIAEALWEIDRDDIALRLQGQSQT